MTYPNNWKHFVAGLAVVAVSAYVYTSGYSATSIESTVAFGVVLLFSLYMLAVPVLEKRKVIPLLERIGGSKPVEYIKNKS
ncbi:hypothetical protein [Halorussus caseinilyticus]|uniref:Uncharacterized protein n=1 Tax=Halorussus caseinilyticus TaxID=3034025 RepID=A0ABD5WPI2_9EURY|nr:hypothetical protein [Halorussus sp. DT72]